MRRSRADTAKSTIAVWRWLCAQPTAPTIKTTSAAALLKDLGRIGEVPNDNGLSDRLSLMESLGLLKRDVEHLGYGKGIEMTISLTERDVDQGTHKIGRHFAEGGFLKPAAKAYRNGTASTPTRIDPEKVVIRTDEKERPVEAVVGEDAPSPFEVLRGLRKDEPAALVEAARQYSRRQDFVLERLDEIEKLGIAIDRSKVMSAIKLETDPEFEGIVKVLPHIDDLEARVKQAQTWRDETISLRNELKELRQAKNGAEADLARQKEANTRLAEKMARETVTRPQVLVGNR